MKFVIVVAYLSIVEFMVFGVVKYSTHFFPVSFITIDLVCGFGGGGEGLGWGRGFGVGIGVGWGNWGEAVVGGVGAG